MASRTLNLNISLTETRQFRRLVKFVQDVEDLARVNADEEFLDLVQHLKADLLEGETR